MTIQVSNSDFILLGHGSYGGGAEICVLPSRIELIILPPLGYSLMTDVAEYLVLQKKIEQLFLHYDNYNGAASITSPMIHYMPGDYVPNLKLYDLGDLAHWGRNLIGDRQNVITVHKEKNLSEILTSDEKISSAKESLKSEANLKVYWSACANQVSGCWASLK
jgi:hypothetical protein